MIELRAVDFAYGDRAILRGVNLGVGPGELVCIVGANGAGKSTLLRLIAGLLSPDRGTVRCFDLDPSRARHKSLARRRAYLPQDYHLAFPFTVREVVLMGRYAHGRRGVLGFESESDRRAATEAMQRCDVLALADRSFDAISGGEQRRALLAQAFCQGTELILLDEPTASLDPAHAIDLFAALAAQRDHGTTAVAVTHELNLAVRFADRVILVDGARIAADGSPGEIVASDATARAFSVAMHVGTLPDGRTPFAVPS